MKRTPSTTAARRRASSAQRGAAMVEAIFVITTLLVFLGGTLFIRDAFLAKLDTQHKMRRDGLAYASHACEGGALEAAVQRGDGSAGNSGSLDPAGSRLANRRGGAEAQLTSESWHVARANASRQVTRDAIVGAGTGLSKVPITRNVTGQSSVFCNERGRDGDIGGWFGFMVELVAQGAEAF